MFNSGPTRCTLFFISFDVSSTCFGCYLHPSSGARLQGTALGPIYTRDTGIQYVNEGYRRNKEASGGVQTMIPVGDTYEIFKFSRSAWLAASVLLRIKQLM
jgi:hypothetical protein